MKDCTRIESIGTGEGSGGMIVSEGTTIVMLRS